MGDFEIIQRTCDGKFDCTNLLAQWNKANKNNIKKIGDYLRLKETKEFVKALMEGLNLKTGIPTFWKVMIIYLRNQYQKRNYPQVFLAS